MLYYLFDYLDKEFDLIGAGVFQYISFRSGMAIGLSLLITILFGKGLIRVLSRRQIKENVRDLGLEGQARKMGTPTMGGIIIIMAIIIPTVLFARLDNIYIILLLVSTIWMGIIGFIDDYIKVFKRSKEGLRGGFKVFGQIGLGLIVSLTLYFHKDVVVREFNVKNDTTMDLTETAQNYEDVKSTITTIPFVKNNQADYKGLSPFGEGFTWIPYALIVTFIVAAVSNGVNMTDGLDGLAAGSSAIVVLTLAVFTYVSGRVDFSQYLNIMYIPNTSELVIFCVALVGACIGFIWYNAYPERRQNL